MVIKSNCGNTKHYQHHLSHIWRENGAFRFESTQDRVCLMSLSRLEHSFCFNCVTYFTTASRLGSWCRIRIAYSFKQQTKMPEVTFNFLMSSWSLNFKKTCSVLLECSEWKMVKYYKKWEQIHPKRGRNMVKTDVWLYKHLYPELYFFFSQKSLYFLHKGNP